MSAFRSLAIAQQGQQSSDSSPTKGDDSQSPLTNDTTRDTSGGLDDGPGDGLKHLNHRKRRAPGAVSGRACNECRTARQRCDGTKAPSREPQAPCSRCQQRGVPCVFEENTKTQKEVLIEQLKGAQTHADELMMDVTKRDNRIIGLEESNDWQSVILRTIGSNGHDVEIIRRLRGGQSHRQIAEWLRGSMPELRNLNTSDIQPFSEIVKIFEKDCQEQIRDGLPPLDGPLLSKLPWTEVTANPNLVSHLLELYFAYVHPVHMLFGELDFKRDFQSGGPIHCSRPLVNAMCAMACYLYNTEHVGHDRFARTQAIVDVGTLRQAFLDEVKRTLDPAYTKLMTSVQTFAILYLISLCAGKARSALGYLETALEGLDGIKQSQQTQESKILTFWGIRTLRTCCVASEYRRLFQPTSDEELDFHHVSLGRDDELWRRYCRSAQNTLPRRPTHTIRTAYYQAQLFQLIEENLSLYCGPKKSVTADAACVQYRKYLAWEEALPPFIRDVREEMQPLLHVLYLHICCETARVQHLTPIIQSKIFTGQNLHELRQFMVSHARKGLWLLQLAQRIYTSRFTMPLVSFCTVYLGDALIVSTPHMSHTPPEWQASEVTRICLDLLQTTRKAFPICGPLQKLLHQRALDHGITMPAGMEEIMGSFSHYGVDDILDACTRLSYVPPLERILPAIHPAIADEWSAAFRRSAPDRSERPALGRVEISDLLN